MIIRRAEITDIENIYVFNAKMFPTKQIDSQRYIDFWLSKSQQAINDILLIVDSNTKIVGQVINSSMSYYYNNEKIDTVWGFDLIVEEQYRKDLWGLDLMIRNKEFYPNFASTGSGPQALGINLKLGMKMLGEIYKYVGIINPLFFFTAISSKNISLKKFPSEVKVKNTIFDIVNKSHIPSLNQPYNNNLFEIARDKDFMQWRYNNLHDYAIYKEQTSNNFFVLRTTIIKHIKVMLLVDYRCHSQMPEQFMNILQAAKRITSKLHLPILITGSTLKTFDEVLEQHHFRSIGRPRPVLGYIKCKDRKEDIEKRNFVFVTLADSDGETNWI